jgi:hypothetical protein
MRCAVRVLAILIGNGRLLDRFGSSNLRRGFNWHSNFRHSFNGRSSVSRRGVNPAFGIILRWRDVH